VILSEKSFLQLSVINIPPFAHTPLRQLADFLQRGRCDGQHTRALGRGNVAVSIDAIQ